ncbi:hypothetical protein BKA81DRAFT_57345 [Phyllosticta paracitricarpa]
MIQASRPRWREERPVTKETSIIPVGIMAGASIPGPSLPAIAPQPTAQRLGSRSQQGCCPRGTSAACPTSLLPSHTAAAHFLCHRQRLESIARAKTSVFWSC